MSTESINQSEAGAAALEPQPIWDRIPGACRVSGFSRSKIYELCKSGAIKSASIREAGQSKGTRLIHRASLLAYIERHATGGDAIN